LPIHRDIQDWHFPGWIFRTAKTTHPSGEILKLPGYCPWKEHLFELEAERGTDPLPKYALYEDTGGAWRIQAIPLTPNSFENRKPLPKAWQGVRDGALDAVSGIDGCVFVHAAGFIGGNKTYEGALAMAAKALTIEYVKWPVKWPVLQAPSASQNGFGRNPKLGTDVPGASYHVQKRILLEHLTTCKNGFFWSEPGAILQVEPDTKTRSRVADPTRKLSSVQQYDEMLYYA
jgi:hypothetical protein